MSAQAKAISEVVKDFEQSLRTYRPSTRRVYVAGARAAIRAASLELWQSPSSNELLASIGESTIEKRARISPFLDFLDGGRSKESVSDEERATLQNWVIQTTREADALREKSLHRNPARHGLDRRVMRGAFKRNSSKMARKLPQNRGPRSAAVGYGNRGTMLRCFLALLACLERAAGPAGPTAALPQIFTMGPVTTPFPRTQRRSLESGSPAQRFAATRRAPERPTASGPSLRKRSEPLSSVGILFK